MAIPFTYDFTTTEDPLSSSFWSTTSGMQPMKASGGQGLKSGTSNDSSMYVSSESFGSDMTISADFATINYDGGLWVRHAGGSNAGYLMRVTSHTNLSIYRVDAPSTYTMLGSIIGGTYNDGDNFEFKVVGDVLSVYQNTSLLGTRSGDTTYTSGSVGLWTWSTGVRWDNVYADTLDVGGGGGFQAAWAKNANMLL